jgi:sugar/nucleoside kinase (ribokinase family)
MSRGLLQLSGIVIDLVTRVDHLPSPGEEVEAPQFLVTAGGGFNAMMAAKRMGAPVTYGGTLGTGLFAEIAVRQLSAEGIAIAATRRVEIDQGTCAVIVDRSGERSFISHHGAERRVEAAYLASLDASSFAWGLLTGYSLYKAESAAAFVPWLANLGTPPKLLFDPGPVVAGIPKPALDAAMARAEWLSANAAEAQVLTGIRDAEAAAAQLAMGREGALVRTGADGCWLAMAGGTIHVSGFKVDAIDSNGAGDTHDGAFLAALIAGHAPREAAVLANAAAALSTTRIGPATSPGLEETHRFLDRNGISLKGPAEWRAARV